MECRALDLTRISAKGLTNAGTSGKLSLYAVASISGPNDIIQKFKTPIHKDGDSDPTWNFPMQFIVYEAARLRNSLTLAVKIKAARMLVDKKLVEVRVPIIELVEGETVRVVSYPGRRRYDEEKVVVSFSYRFGKIEVDAPENVALGDPRRSGLCC